MSNNEQRQPVVPGLQVGAAQRDRPQLFQSSALLTFLQATSDIAEVQRAASLSCAEPPGRCGAA
jgi:hypothetical protein